MGGWESIVNLVKYYQIIQRDTESHAKSNGDKRFVIQWSGNKLLIKYCRGGPSQPIPIKLGLSGPERAPSAVKSIQLSTSKENSDFWKIDGGERKIDLWGK